MRHFAILFFVGLSTTAAAQMHVRRELQGCTDCPAGSPGNECQGNIGGICYNVNPQTGDCPLGTTSCAGVIATATPCRDSGSGAIDEGCNATYPVCVSANGGQVVGGDPGHHCAYCINSLQPNRINQVQPDEGCDATARVCVDGIRQLAADVEGSTCAVCYNSIAADLDPNDIDDGCPPSAPVCVNDSGDSPAIWTPGTACVANCVDTSRSDADEGCPTNHPICALEDGRDPGAGNPGVRCVNTVATTCDAATENDWMCSVPVPICSQFPPVAGFRCICDIDLAGDPLCWRDAFCGDLIECASNADCANNNEKCVSTCCGEGHCLEDCAWTGNTRRRSLEEGRMQGETTATGA